jgi:hypothetical protein
VPRAKRLIQSALIVDGISLIWHLHREQQWCTADGWKGVAVHVGVAEGTYRELFLEYPTAQKQKKGYTLTSSARPPIRAAKIETHIRQAIAAGWDPNSRGKPFVYQVSELPN